MDRLMLFLINRFEVSFFLGSFENKIHQLTMKTTKKKLIKLDSKTYAELKAEI